MPYIKEIRRKAILGGESPKDMGELNFLMTKELIQRWESFPRYETIHKLFTEFFENPQANEFVKNFAAINRQFTSTDVIGAARLAYLEFYRRVGSKYEDLKALENGDVYQFITLKGKTSAR